MLIFNMVNGDRIKSENIIFEDFENVLENTKGNIYFIYANDFVLLETIWGNNSNIPIDRPKQTINKIKAIKFSDIRYIEGD